MAFNVEDMDTIWVDGTKFKGIGYQGLLTVNTKTYVESPSRANDGSIPNINDHDTFIVPRAKINFKLFSIEDYQMLCKIVNRSNEFTVKYFDKEIGDFVIHNMYCEPEEMKKMFNVGTRVIGVLDYEISFVGTLNERETYQVVYYLNPSNTGSSNLSIASYKWGSSMDVMTGEEMTKLSQEKGFSLPNKTFIGWNTQLDGSGIYYFPNKKVNVLENLNLYAIWE